MAASDLKYLKTGKSIIKLKKPMDVALWRKPDGSYEGVIQSSEPVKRAATLLKFTKKWSYLHLPQLPANFIKND